MTLFTYAGPVKKDDLIPDNSINDHNHRFADTPRAKLAYGTGNLKV